MASAAAKKASNRPVAVSILSTDYSLLHTHLNIQLRFGSVGLDERLAGGNVGAYFTISKKKEGGYPPLYYETSLIIIRISASVQSKEF